MPASVLACKLYFMTYEVDIHRQIEFLNHYKASDPALYGTSMMAFLELWKDYAPNLCKYLKYAWKAIQYDCHAWNALKVKYKDEMDKAQKMHDIDQKKTEIRLSMKEYEV